MYYTKLHAQLVHAWDCMHFSALFNNCFSDTLKDNIRELISRRDKLKREEQLEAMR